MTHINFQVTTVILQFLIFFRIVTDRAESTKPLSFKLLVQLSRKKISIKKKIEAKFNDWKHLYEFQMKKWVTKLLKLWISKFETFGLMRRIPFRLLVRLLLRLLFLRGFSIFSIYFSYERVICGSWSFLMCNNSNNSPQKEFSVCLFSGS